MKYLYEAERHVRAAKTQRGETAWWYVDRALCSFHHSNGALIHIPTAMIRRALEALDRQMAREGKEQP